MEKFEIGDKVKLVRLDTKDLLYVSSMRRFLGKTGTVESITCFSENPIVHFDKNDEATFVYSINWLELVEKHKPYWNGQFIVVGECSIKSWLCPKRRPVTVGKVYELKDGKATLDDRLVIQNYHYKSFDDFAARLRDFGVRIIEFKGFCRNKGKEQNE